MEKLNKEKYIKRIIVISWIVLAICFVIKLFGGNLFQIICKNETFIAICNFCEDTIWLYCIFAITNNFINSYFMILAMCGKSKFKSWELIAVFVGCAVSSCFKIFVNRELGAIFDFVNVIIVPCLFTLKTPKRHWFVIVGNILLIVFQMVSMFVKNLGLVNVATNGMLISLIYSIDVVVMLILYYLYVNLLRIKKEGENNG